MTTSQKQTKIKDLRNYAKPKEIRNLGIYGVIRRAEVDDKLIPEGAVVEAINVHFDRKGATTQRLGLANLGSTVSNTYPCLGIHNAQSSTLLAAFSTAGTNCIYRYNGTVWSECLTTDTAGYKTRFVDFAGRTIRVNGVDGSMRCWNGSADGTSYWDYTGNPINPQQVGNNSIKPKYIEVYKSKVYISGDPNYPSRLFYSSVISSAGNITWTPATDFVDINPSDGEDNSALKRYSLELLFFKPNYIYRFRTTGIDPDPLIKIGTRSNESVIEGKKGLYFHHDTGFYRYSGGYPDEISRPISDIVTAIPFTSFASICSWKDEDHIYWSVGNLTVDNNSWPNTVVRFTESSEVWTVYSYACGINWGNTYITSSSLSRVIGTDKGAVATVNSGNSDLGEPIKFRVITKWYEWDGIHNQKTIEEIVAVCEKAQGVTIRYQTDDNILEWISLGQAEDLLTDFDDIAIEFHRIRFKIDGVSKTQPVIFMGLEIPLVTNDGIIFEGSNF